MTYKMPSNREIAAVMDTIADLLEIQHANPYKVRAYRGGAKAVRAMAKAVTGIVFSGDGEALQAMPGIGESLSAPEM